MRICRNSVFITVVGVLISLSSADSVEAQTFFQTFFGAGKAPSSHAPVNRRRRALPSRPLRYSRIRHSYYNQQRRNWRSQANAGRYRTLCVRTCDGYYFPISAAASRYKFVRDSRICKARCGQDSQLFYHSVRSRNSESMVSLRGQSYKSIENAFRYRKERVDGCSCRPEPWSIQEVARHQGYAAQAQMDRLQNESALARKRADAFALATKQPRKRYGFRSKAGRSPVFQDFVGAVLSEDHDQIMPQSGRIASNDSIDLSDHSSLQDYDTTNVPDTQIETEAGDGLPYVALRQRSQNRYVANRSPQRTRRKFNHKKRKPRKTVSKAKKPTVSWFKPGKSNYRWPGD